MNIDQRILNHILKPQGVCTGWFHDLVSKSLIWCPHSMWSIPQKSYTQKVPIINCRFKLKIKWFSNIEYSTSRSSNNEESIFQLGILSINSWTQRFNGLEWVWSWIVGSTSANSVGSMDPWGKRSYNPSLSWLASGNSNIKTTTSFAHCNRFLLLFFLVIWLVVSQPCSCNNEHLPTVLWVHLLLCQF